jgi:hypothetical protein|mmetsp:Transcript_6927/g.13163  ORF Transcript_6927/g.13163 Transcript_6927/m.13163 type:complete len:98 (+) Transcript_6927:197-490(+)
MAQVAIPGVAMIDIRFTGERVPATLATNAPAKYISTRRRAWPHLLESVRPASAFYDLHTTDTTLRNEAGLVRLGIIDCNNEKSSCLTEGMTGRLVHS